MHIHSFYFTVGLFLAIIGCSSDEDDASSSSNSGSGGSGASSSSGESGGSGGGATGSGGGATGSGGNSSTGGGGGAGGGQGGFGGGIGQECSPPPDGQGCPDRLACCPVNATPESPHTCQVPCRGAGCTRDGCPAIP